jgi:hypothetical protein
MSKTQIRSLGRAVLVVAGTVAAFGSSSFAQDAPALSAGPTFAPQVTYPSDQPVVYAPRYTGSHCGGPYKGFYPCNGRTPYFGGACYVYGDAPLYTAPADYGHHCAAWCP